MKLINTSIVISLVCNVLSGQPAYYQAKYLNTIDTSLTNYIILNNSCLELSDYELSVISAFNTLLVDPFSDSILTVNLDYRSLDRIIKKYNSNVEKCEKIKLINEKLEVSKNKLLNFIKKFDSENSKLSEFKIQINRNFWEADEDQIKIILDKCYTEFAMTSSSNQLIKNKRIILDSIYTMAVEEKIKIDDYIARVNSSVYILPFKSSRTSTSGKLSASIISTPTNILSALSNQQTVIIDGIAKYYADEFREAQTVSYMNIFRSYFDEIGEFKILFPSTYLKLKNTDPSSFPDIGNSLKLAFSDDLGRLVENLIEYIDNPDTENDKNYIWLKNENISKIKSNNLYNSLKISVDIASKVVNNCHPSELLQSLDNKYYVTNGSLNTGISNRIISLIHVINTIQKNLIDTTRTPDQFSNIWISQNHLMELSQKEWVLFTGIIYQQDRSFFKEKLRINDYNTTEIPNKIKSYINIISASLSELQSIKSNFEKDNNTITFSKYIQFYVKTLENSNELLFRGESKNDDELFEKFVILAKNTVKIYENTTSNNYTNSIDCLLQIIQQIIPDENNNQNIEKLLHYGRFMADVINIDSSEQMKELIKRYAAPPSSYITKRYNNFTFSVTGQPGYFLGFEKLDNEGENFELISGITLPIGFDLTFGGKHDKIINERRNKPSISIFTQIVDLGAVLNFRLIDSDSSLPDKIDIKQILSQGISLNYGFKNSPWTLGVGYQRTPQLRKVTIGGNEIYPQGDRYYLRLACDIPLFYVYPRRKGPYAPKK